FTVACGQDVKNVDLKTFDDSVSYAIGADIARNFATQKMDINGDAFVNGFMNVTSKGDVKISEDEALKILTKYKQIMTAKIQAKENAASVDNLKKGEEFLTANKTKDGVKVTASGLQYKVINLGTGAKPLSTDKVKVHYKGTLLDGTEFDSSYKRGTPAEFPLANVIPGWTEGIQLMPVGSKYEFYIPSALDYGEKAPQTIGPNQTLIFEVELLEIVK
ncbi:MAG: FKBP-type peptidyl-prolyl cis-trans isomerase, partial [Melioribacteraceae bacterium]|nr:FKBP-type peptidyl-prolyl cis-trans isomerase [Melioribacteraceae bacterium]